LLHHAFLLQQMAELMRGQSFVRRQGVAYSVAETLDQAAEFMMALEGKVLPKIQYLPTRWN